MTDVSVVIPTHDRAELLQDALASCLAEGERPSAPSIQVVIVDDASTDETAQVLESCPPGVESVRLDENVGASEARNVGLAHARGEFVKFLDSDDVLLPGSLAEELAVARDEGADMVVSGWEVVQIDSDRREVPGTRKVRPAPRMEPVVEAVLAGRASATSAVLYRRGYIGGLRWDSTVIPIDDWDWFCRAALRRGRIVTLDRSSYRMRAHAGPRVTSGGGLIRYAHAHHRILGKLEDWLTANDAWTEPRRKRMAQYYYKQLSVLVLHDRPAFDRALDRIRQLDPDFVPRDEELRSYMRMLARLLGTRQALLLYATAKKLLGRT